MVAAAAFLPDGRGNPGAGAARTGAFFVTRRLLIRIRRC